MAATLLPHPQTKSAAPDLEGADSSEPSGPVAFSEMTSHEQAWYAVAVAPNGDKLILNNLSAPTLGLTKAGALVIVSWPASFTGFILQESTELTNNDWTDVTNQVDVVAGENQVTIMPQEANSFFRLKSVY